MCLQFFVLIFIFIIPQRSKNFNKGGEWDKDGDGKANTDGPRMIVGDGNMGPSGGFVTKLVVRGDLG